jgi:outer membrane receptor protein involved in Fe transport
VSESAGSCTLDSLTSFNVMSNSVTSPLHLGHRDAYGMNTSGGSDAVRFFVSGDIQNETGPMHMPAFAKLTLDSMGTSMRDEWDNPEALQTYNMRTNLTASLTPKFDLNVSAGYSNTNQRVPQLDNNIVSVVYSALNNPGFNHSFNPGYTTGLNYNEVGTLSEFRNGYGAYSPAQIFQSTAENGTQRFIGSADGNWRPFSWMQNQGTAGIDLANDDYLQLCRFNECPNQGTTRQGQVTNTQTNYRNFSAKLVSNMTWQFRQSLNFKTTVGADYANLEQDGVSDNAVQLPPGAQSPFQGAVKGVGTSVTNLQQVNKTLGFYVQEQASIRDRLFLTVAARSDQNSSFGTQFQHVVYPKASVSWIASDESFFPKFNWLNQFRFRSAYGASGVQPGGTVALQQFNASTAAVPAIAGTTTGTDTPGLIASALGNPELQPERSTEFEGGFETSVLNNRLHIDATYYNKKTKDALISRQIAASSGTPSLTLLDNLGSVSNSGFELSVNTTIIDRRALGWDVTIAGSHNSNKVLSVGNDATGKPLPTIGTGTTRDSVGVPVNGFFARPYTYADKNGDGIITPDEVTIQSAFQYVGYSLPRDIISITNGFDLFSRHLRLTVLTDYKGGYSLYNQTGQFYSSNFATWYSENVKSTPLWDQARTVANSSAKNPTTSTLGFLENGQFWKLREVSAALTLPQSVANRIRARDAQIVFSARNLHTWTSYTGSDPEAGYSTGNQDVQTDFSTVAPRAYFVLRANLHY